MEIQELAARMYTDGARWFPSTEKDLMNITLGICGEAGEVADIVKKLGRGTMTLQAAVDEIKVELIDVLYYTLHLCHLLQIDIEMEYIKKSAFNDERFGRTN